MSDDHSPHDIGDSLDPAQCGYTVVSNYALYFWRPYLGNTAFALWELLLSFCYGERDIAYPSISRLARMLTNSDHNRAVVTGRRRRAKDAGAASPSRHEGALDILHREGLVQVIRRGYGPTASYTFRVCKTLPLLRPEQVARLSPSLQRDHANWLERHGIGTPPCEEALAPAASPPSAAPHTTPIAPSPTPDASRPSPTAPNTARPVLPLTNNSREENLMNHWWQEALDELRLQLTRSAFETCLLRSKAHSFHDGVLMVQAPGDLAREKLQHRLAPLIRRVLLAVSDAQVQQVCFFSVGQQGTGQAAQVPPPAEG
ncbi:MAG: hypothetical protein H5T68_11880 [Chloroflexi bacterium]|nr:hypothetical protein [Chloroflexota bacterium]